MHSNRGFTLIELLIVVAIIAILAAIAVPNFLEAQVRSKVTRCKSELRTIAAGMEAYRTDNNMYPPDWDSGQFGPPPGGGGWRSEYLTYANLTTPVAYLASVPLDLFSEKHHKAVPYYQYNSPPPASVRPSVGGSWTAMRENGVHWSVTTFGPDLIDQALWAANLANPADVAMRTYDPTNGTRSLGDIGRNNRGSFPE